MKCQRFASEEAIVVIFKSEIYDVSVGSFDIDEGDDRRSRKFDSEDEEVIARRQVPSFAHLFESDVSYFAFAWNAVLVDD